MLDIKLEKGKQVLLYDITEGDFRVVSGKEEVAQAVSTRLQMWLGEYFMDKTMGLDYLNELMEKNYEPETIKAKIELECLAVKNVTGISGINLTRSNGSCTISIDLIETVYGNVAGVLI